VGTVVSSDRLSLIFLHGEYGWQGFALAVLGVIALVALFNELADRALKRNRYKKHHKYGAKWGVIVDLSRLKRSGKS
jgi:hypothetical protein